MWFWHPSVQQPSQWLLLDWSDPSSISNEPQVHQYGPLRIFQNSLQSQQRFFLQMFWPWQHGSLFSPPELVCKQDALHHLPFHVLLQWATDPDPFHVLLQWATGQDAFHVFLHIPMWFWHPSVQQPSQWLLLDWSDPSSIANEPQVHPYEPLRISQNSLQSQPRFFLQMFWLWQHGSPFSHPELVCKQDALHHLPFPVSLHIPRWCVLFWLHQPFLWLLLVRIDHANTPNGQ